MTDHFEEGQLVDNRYRVVGKIGGGGMADVYLAEDTTLGRRVALKVLLKRFSGDEQFIERFRREAKAAAGLNHPNVVGIYDWGQIGPLYYIVMEYVEGETLKEQIRGRGRLSGGDAVAMVLELLSAVEFAHANHVVHRDIKAQNILIDSTGKLKVTDFGIARAGDSQMTEVGSVLGTAQYLAPEQARGETVDERSDLYSVGVVLYEMLTGVVPFTGDSAVTVALKHVNELPVEPGELVPGLPYSLNQIVLKALAKDPARRYQSAAEFTRDLRSAQTGGPLLAAAFDFADERTQVLRPTAFDREDATQVMNQRDPLDETRVGRPGTAQKRGRRRGAMLLVVVILLLMAGLAYAFIHTFSGNTVKVPSVVGQTQAAATKALKAEGFTVRVETAASDAYGAGLVISQNPPADTELRKGGEVTITVSEGAKTITLINLSGMTAAQAEDWLTSNGLVGKELKGPSDAALGRIYKQDPATDATVERGATITYWVSSGAAKVKVPDLSGLTRVDAEQALLDKGLGIGIVSTEPSDSIPVDEVVSQSPAADTKVSRGSSVDYVVSSGPSSASPSATMVPVPDVLTKPYDEATSELEAAGFTVSVKEKGGSMQPPGTVTDQSPGAGVEAPEGSEVVITVAKF